MSRVLSRRTLIRGLGAAVALPWLEVMQRTTALAATPARPPVRLGFFYVPNGVHMPHWRPAGERLDSLPPILQPLVSQEVVDQAVVISNLEAKHCFAKGAGHEPAGGGFLVGKKCKHSEDPEVGGISVDQLAARQLGLRTAVDSLALGIDPGHAGDHGYSGTYLSHISWRSQRMPAALELNPRHLFDRLFRDGTPPVPDWTTQSAPSTSRRVADPVQASVLDLVREDTRSLQRQLGFADRRRLEDYLEGLRSIERRVEVAERDDHSHHQDAFDEDPANRALHEGESADDVPQLVFPKGSGIPSIYGDHVNLMLDILTIAMQTDTTRVATFMFSYEKSGRSYPQIDAPGSHHSTSHHQGKPENHAELTKINTHHMELFARMLAKMAAIEEGDSTLLNNVAFLYGSGISDGNKHNHDDLPVVVAGGGGGAIRGGRHLKMPSPTPLCNVYLDMLQAAGLEKNQFGDSTGPTGKLS